MYVPAEDTFLLAECIGRYSGRWALEIGVGSGVLLKVLEKNFQRVAGSDIDLEVLRRSKQSNAVLVCCDAASAFSNIKIDLIVSNPPYLPDDMEKDAAVRGGPSGIETTIHFIRSALPLLEQDGKMLLVVSSLADLSALDRLAAEMKLRKRIIKEKNLFFEKLSIIELSR